MRRNGWAPDPGGSGTQGLPRLRDRTDLAVTGRAQTDALGPVSSYMDCSPSSHDHDALREIRH
jgi:hypothetical protein